MNIPVPYPPDTRAKGWRFEIDHERIRQSDTWALASPDVRPWLLMLWMVAWEQTPCGSLPADDTLIAARIGMSAKAFAKHRDILMRGWVQAEDGRLYHPVLTLRVNEMLAKRAKDATRAANARAKRNDKEGQPRESRDSHADVTRDAPVSSTPSTKHQAPDKNTQASANGISARSTPAGEVCARLMREGIQAVNPQHPKLLALLDAGLTVDEIAGIGPEAKQKGKGFAWILATAEGRRRDAANVQKLPSLPAGEWFTSASGIEAEGAKRNLVRGRDETFPAYKVRVFNAAGVTPEMLRRAEVDRGGRT